MRHLIRERDPERGIAEGAGGIRIFTEPRVNEIILIVEEAAEGGLTARTLDYAISTDAETMGTLRGGEMRGRRFGVR